MIELLKKLKKIDPELTLTIGGQTIVENMIKQDGSNQTYINTQPRLPGRFYGEGPLSAVMVQVRLKKTLIFSMTLSEFYPCCGKVLGWDLNSSNVIYSDFTPETIEESKLNNIFKVFLDMVECIIKYANYSSMSFIVSDKQTLFHKLISNVSTYKIVNEFKNKRMDNKTVCLEYCRNVW